MGSLVETIEKKKRFQLIPSMRLPYKDDLPITSSSSSSSQSIGSKAEVVGIRKRMSSFSVNIQPCLSSSGSSAWGLRKPRSMPWSLGEYLAGVGRWWGWLLSKKPTFARDIEMNEEEMAVLGCNSKGTLSHLFYKLRSRLRPHHSTTLPITHNFTDANAI